MKKYSNAGCAYDLIYDLESLIEPYCVSTFSVKKIVDFKLNSNVLAAVTFFHNQEIYILTISYELQYYNNIPILDFIEKFDTYSGLGEAYLLSNLGEALLANTYDGIGTHHPENVSSNNIFIYCNPSAFHCSMPLESLQEKSGCVYSIEYFNNFFRLYINLNDDLDNFIHILKNKKVYAIFSHDSLNKETHLVKIQTVSDIINIYYNNNSTINSHKNSQYLVYLDIYNNN